MPLPTAWILSPPTKFSSGTALHYKGYIILKNGKAKTTRITINTQLTRDKSFTSSLSTVSKATAGRMFIIDTAVNMIATPKVGEESIIAIIIPNVAQTERQARLRSSILVARFISVHGRMEDCINWTMLHDTHQYCSNEQ